MDSWIIDVIPTIIILMLFLIIIISPLVFLIVSFLKKINRIEKKLDDIYNFLNRKE